MGVNILNLVNKNLKSSGLQSAFEKAGLTEKEISHISNEIGSKSLSFSENFKGYTVNTELSKDFQNNFDNALSAEFASTNLLLHSPTDITAVANKIADMETDGVITDAMGDKLSAYFVKRPSSEYIAQNINTLRNSPYLDDDVVKLMESAGYDLRQGTKSAANRGPTTPEQELAEELTANNAKLLEEGGQPVAEPPKVTPQPSQPVPDKTVTAPEPKPVDPVPETGKPVTTPKEESVINSAPESTVTNNVEQQRLASSQKYVNDYNAKKEQVQQALGIGSGKSIQESAQKSANKAAAADISSDPANMTIDRAMLQQQIGGDKTTWGHKDASEYLLNNTVTKLESKRDAIAKSKNLTTEQKLSEWNRNKKEAADILAEGPGIGDYFFGNKLHYAAVGSAALFGAGSQVFGGHKSNAELYSSPF